MGGWTRGTPAFCSALSTGSKRRIRDWSAAPVSTPRRARTVRSRTSTRAARGRAGVAFEGAPAGGAHLPLDDGRDVHRGGAGGTSLLRTPRDTSGVAVRQPAAAAGSPRDAFRHRVRPQRGGAGPLRAP